MSQVPFFYVKTTDIDWEPFSYVKTKTFIFGCHSYIIVAWSDLVTENDYIREYKKRIFT